MKYIFKVPGTPIAKKRPRFARKGHYVQTYSNQRTEEGRFLLMLLEQWDGRPLECALYVKMDFSFLRPKGHFGTGKNEGELKKKAPLHHLTKPDIDNCIKFALDCMNGIVFNDDKQIVKLIANKHYSDKANTLITVEKILKGGML